MQHGLFEELPEQSDFSSDDYYTPRWIFDSLGLVFDVDVCSPPQETSVPCHKRYTIKDDGLACDWNGLVWMNPPYSNPTPWMARFLNHKGGGICLVQISRAKWFNALWESANALVLMPSNLKFDTPSGVPKAIFMPTLLASIGDKATEALRCSGIGRVVM